MAKNWRKVPTCCLCGEKFLSDSANEDEMRTRAHVPPQQFYPKETRDGLNMWCSAAHRRCNNAFKKDEEYFYTAFYPQVANVNPEFSKIYLNDISRQAKQPQIRSRLKMALRETSTMTPGGIHLPPGVIRWDIDEERTNRVAISIAQGLSSYHDDQYLPADTCVNICLCLDEQNVPDEYTLVCKHTHQKTVKSDIFSYWRIDLKEENLKRYALLFWESFMICLAFSY